MHANAQEFRRSPQQGLEVPVVTVSLAEWLEISFWTKVPQTVVGNLQDEVAVDQTDMRREISVDVRSVPVYIIQALES